MSPLEQWVSYAIAALAAVGWLFYFRWKDRARPEPVWLVAAAVSGGAMAVLLAFLGFAVADSAWTETRWEDLQTGDLMHASVAALRVGLVEELSKLVVVLPIALWASAFDELLDGIVYAASAAVGFATAETFLQFHLGSWPFEAALARALAGGVTHALVAAPWGLGLALAVVRKRRLALAIGLGASVVAHAAYDFMLARPELHPAASAALVLVLWVWMVFVARRLERASPVVGATPR